MGIFDLFGNKKDITAESTPQNDAERWIRGIYAIWSEYCNGSYLYIGGFQKTRSNVRMVRGVLSRDWLITNREGGLDMVPFIIADEEKLHVIERKSAFNFCCALNIYARMYVGGHITREEAMYLSKEIGRTIQKHYSSWDNFCQSYIEGTKLESGIASDTAQFIEIYERLKSLPDSPYQIDWNTVL